MWGELIYLFELMYELDCEFVFNVMICVDVGICIFWMFCGILVWWFGRFFVIVDFLFMGCGIVGVIGVVLV